MFLDSGGYRSEYRSSGVPSERCEGFPPGEGETRRESPHDRPARTVHRRSNGYRRIERRSGGRAAVTTVDSESTSKCVPLSPGGRRHTRTGASSRSHVSARWRSSHTASPCPAFGGRGRGVWGGSTATPRARPSPGRRHASQSGCTGDSGACLRQSGTPRADRHRHTFEQSADEPANTRNGAPGVTTGPVPRTVH